MLQFQRSFHLTGMVITAYNLTVILFFEESFMAYTKEFEIHIHNTDQNRIMPPAEILRMMHVTTDYQMHAEGCTIEEVQEQGMAMVLSKLFLCFYEPVHVGQVLCVTTWPCKSRGFQMDRCYRAKVGDTVVAEGVSTWALIDINTHRLLRSDKVDFSHYTFGDKFDIDTKIAPYQGEYEAAGTHRVSYSDVDTYGHMNNTHYIDMICDLIPEMEKKKPAALQIHFRNEAPMGSEIEVCRAQCGDTFYFRSTVAQKANIEAAIRVEK